MRASSKQERQGGQRALVPQIDGDDDVFRVRYQSQRWDVQTSVKSEVRQKSQISEPINKFCYDVRCLGDKQQEKSAANDQQVEQGIHLGISDKSDECDTTSQSTYCLNGVSEIATGEEDVTGVKRKRPREDVNQNSPTDVAMISELPDLWLDCVGSPASVSSVMATASMPLPPPKALQRREVSPLSKDDDTTTRMSSLSRFRDDDDCDNGLTLYERHRKPRPLVKGRVRVPLEAVEEEFKCVICLDYIRKAKLVRECLHRFCEECIEKSLRSMASDKKKRNECPICRVLIPSRRSLMLDPAFDKMLDAILGYTTNLKSNDGSNSSTPNNGSKIHQNHVSIASSLQRAIYQKKLANIQSSPSPTPDGSSEKDHENSEVISPPSTSVSSNSILDIVLLRHPKETQVENLLLPHLRMSSTTPIHVICEFLRCKLLPKSKKSLQFRLSTVQTGGVKSSLAMEMTLFDVVVTGDGSTEIVTIFYKTVPRYRMKTK